MLSRFAKVWAARYADWRRRQRALEELSALDDRSLADIGISRSDIPFVVGTEPASSARAKEIAVRGLKHAA